MSRAKSSAPKLVPPAMGATSDVRPRVLVVDDDELVAAGHVRVLRAVASNVSVALDATQALVLLTSNTYDVVVCDVQMHGINGIEMVRTVREKDLDLPVVLVTGGASVESAADAIELSAFRYLQKPVAPETLRRTVSEAAQARRLATTKRGVVADDEHAPFEVRC